jgi:hypothetical protein
MSYAAYTHQFNDFLRRSRQYMTDDLQCVRFINGLANFQLHIQAKSHRSQRGNNVKLVELRNFHLNDVVTDSPHMGGVRSTVGLSTTPGGGQPSKKRYEDP